MIRLLLILLLPQLLWAATVTDDTLVGTLCSDGLLYLGDCPASTETYYIDSVAGNDNNSGLSMALAWRNLSKINTITRIGADVCLMDDSDWTLTSNLTLAHAGTETDPAKIKGCYSDGGVPTDYQSGSGSGRGAKPTIRGTITAACVAADNCTTWSNTGSLVRIAGTDVHVEYISLFGAPGQGILFGHGDNNNTIAYRRLRLVGSDFSHVGKQAIVFTRGVQEAAIKGNTLTMSSLCQVYDNVTCPIWGSALTISMTPPQARVLVENNDCYNTAGECFVATGNQGVNSSHIVFRGNRVGDNHSTSYYFDMLTDSVIESNITVGPSPLFTARPGASGFGGGIRASVEINGQSNERILVRNNLSANGEDYGFATVVFATPAAAGRTTSSKAFGNTVVSTDNPRDIGILRSTVQFYWRSNVAYSLALAAGSKCSYQTTIGTDISFGYNLWNVAPSDSRCRGTGDKTGDPLFPLSYAAFDNLTHQNMPTFADVTPPAGSPLKASGDASLVTSTCIDTSGWGTWIFTQMEYPYTPASAAEWALCLRRDALGNLRSTTAPTIGAME